MKYFTEEITTLIDGTSACLISEKTDAEAALSGYHQAMASAIINPNVATIHAEAKNSVGGILGKDTWTRPTEVAEPEV